MKILLINPPNSGKSIPEEYFGINSIKAIFRGEPFSLEVLAGNLAGHEVEILDLKVEPEMLNQKLDNFRPDVVGFTGVTCEANIILRMADTVKNNYGATIVVGGHHASSDPSFYNTNCIDYVAIGIGKRSFRELISSLDEGKRGEGIPGVAKVAAGNELKYKRAVLTSDDLLDEVPPAYGLVKKYRDEYFMSGVGGKVGYVVSAFGCTHRCSFCSIPSITGGKYLLHSMDSVVRDIRLLEDIPLIRLVDANTFGNPPAAGELAGKIIEAGIKKRFVADVRSDTVIRNPDLFALWKEVGLYAVVIGFEEVSDTRLEVMNKKNSVKTNIRAIEILKDLGIMIVGDFIISPDYTETEFDLLEKFVDDNGINVPIPSILTPLPGTPLYMAMNDRITIRDLDYYTVTNAVMETKMSEKDFYTRYSEMMKKFHRNIISKKGD